MQNKESNALNELAKTSTSTSDDGIETNAFDKPPSPPQLQVNSLEDKLYQYIDCQFQKHQINKIFFIPVGLPGMGKTTLSRFMNNNLNKFLFLQISYDDIFSKMMKQYVEEHPEVDMHTAFDIIRSHADQEYLNRILMHCDEVDLQQIIYLDRNNTPDIWKDIQITIQMATQHIKIKHFKTVLIVPEQHSDFNQSFYNTFNPICPQMIYQCIKRIFNRKSHDCLSSENKPKVVEVLLKFTKLYDGIDLNSDEVLLNSFDDYIKLDFLQFKKQKALDQETLDVLISGYNQTPPNFQPPNDDVINTCMKAIDNQIAKDLAQSTDMTLDPINPKT